MEVIREVVRIYEGKILRALAKMEGRRYSASMIPAILGVKHLCGASSDKGRAARTDRFPVGTPLHPIDVDGKEFQTVLAVAQLILLIHVIAAPGADERAPSLRVIHIDPVAARPTLVHLDVKMTVIDHMPETAFITYHEVPPFWMLLASDAYRSSNRPQLFRGIPGSLIDSTLVCIMLQDNKVNPDKQLL